MGIQNPKAFAIHRELQIEKSAQKKQTNKQTKMDERFFDKFLLRDAKLNFLQTCARFLALF